jgi:hypothetical protein
MLDEVNELMNMDLERFRDVTIPLVAAENLLSPICNVISLSPKLPLEFVSLVSTV